MIKNMCMIKFDILANKGMGYNKGKIENKKMILRVLCYENHI